MADPIVGRMTSVLSGWDLEIPIVIERREDGLIETGGTGFPVHANDDETQAIVEDLLLIGPEPDQDHDETHDAIVEIILRHASGKF